MAVAMLAAVGSGAASASTPKLVRLAGTVSPLLSHVQRVGTVSSKTEIQFDLALNMRDKPAAESLVAAVSTPGSSRYRHYLTTEQAEARFSPTTHEVAAAEAWVRSEGLRVGAVSKDHFTIGVSGTAAAIEHAFGVQLGLYRFQSKVVRLTTAAVRVPASLAGILLGPVGLSQYLATPAAAGSAPAKMTPAATPKATAGIPAPGAFVAAPPCSDAFGGKTETLKPAYGHGYPAAIPVDVCGYVGSQYRSAYGIPAADTGKGVKVAVIDAYGSSTILKDAETYFSRNDKTAPFEASQFAQEINGPFDDAALCGASGWSVEQAIDVESVHSMAPSAHILYVGAQDCVDGLLTAEEEVIDNDQADIVTNSWGDTGGDVFDDLAYRSSFDEEFLLGDMTGISILFSSGDDGDDFALFGIATADYPPSSPWVTAVGGTSLEIGAKGQRLAEYGWSTYKSILCTSSLESDGYPGCTSKTLNTWLAPISDGGGGGFTSYQYSQPAYQAKVVPQDLAYRNEAIDGPTPMRVEPDISMDADPSTGFLIGLTEAFPNGKVEYGQTRYGGTSLASPLLAGVIADSDGAAGASAGFINPTIYTFTYASGALYDIVPGSHSAQYRVDFANQVGVASKGVVQSFRIITYEGIEEYCDATGNCVVRKNTLTTAKGYDSMTGLGSAGRGFVAALAKG